MDHSMDLEALLAQFSQRHLLDNCKGLSPAQKKQLTQQIKHWQANTTFSPQLEKTKEDLSPLSKCPKPMYEDIDLGNKLIQEGKAAAILLAGGLGTRLGIEGPKGCFGISPVKKKSFFQLFCEKIKAQQEQLHCRILAAVMVSASNHEQTVPFFEKHQYWGLSKGQFLFFEQDNVPYFDNEGNWFWAKQGVIAHSPNGNGLVFHYLHNTKALTLLQKAGVQYLQLTQVDNPLALPLDPGLIGFQAKANADVVLGAVERLHAQEMLGLIIKENKKPKVVEYSEVSESVFQEILPNKKLKYRFGNSGIQSFSMAFIEEIIKKQASILPIHWVKKKTRQWNGAFFEDIWAWKVEHFVFDWLAYAKKSKAVWLDRTMCYAPLKRQQGTGGIAFVQDALLEKDRKILAKITCQDTENRFFELSLSFHYPTEKLLSEWRHRPLPQASYIFADMH